MTKKETAQYTNTNNEGQYTIQLHKMRHKTKKKIKKYKSCVDSTGPSL